MSIRIIYGKAGTGKSEYCFREIAKLIEKEKKIFIITPEQFSFTAEKKLMEEIKEKALINAEVITFNRMAYRVLNETGGATKTNLSKCGQAMLVYSILNENKKKLKFLGKSDQNVDLCIRAITELKKHGIKAQNIQQEIDVLENKYLKTKLQDINLIYESFEKQIKDKYIDETDLLTILAEKIEQTDLFKNSIIYIDEFVGFTAQEYEVIKKLLKVSKKLTITVCADGLQGNINADTDVFYSNKITVSKILRLLEDNEKIEQIYLSENKRFKKEELQHLEKNIYANRYDKYEKEVNNIKLFLAQNQYSEIENVAKNIIKLVRDEEYRYKDISVITKQLNIYSSLIRAIFEKYQIPVFIDEKRELSQNIVIQYILSIIEIFNKNWSYESVFNYIKTGFTGIEEEDIFKLENYCIKWGIKYNKWKSNFNIFTVEENEKSEIKRLNEIRKQIINPIIEFKEKIEKEKSFENISIALYDFLQSQGFEEKLQKKIENLEKRGLIDLANEYRESYKIIINLLDEMILIFKQDIITFEKYLEILKVGLKNSGLGKIPGTADQVIVGDVERSRSHKVKAIFIIGLNDGCFPSVNREEGFLNDSDREKLKEDGIELANSTIENIYEERFNIYKAFSTAENKLYLSYASSDTEGKSLRASTLIPKIKKIFINLKEESDIVSKEVEILTPEATYEDLINNIDRLNCGEQIDKTWYNVYKYYKETNRWNKKLQEDLKGLNYTNLPEKIDTENINKLYGSTLNTSVSKLEKYRKCPFSYYLQYGLRLKEREELKVQSLNTGTFMHEVIDTFFNKIREEKVDILDINDEKIQEIVKEIIDEMLKVNRNFIFTSSAKYKLLVIRLERLISKALKYILETLSQSKFKVLGTEVEFGEKGRYKPIILNLEDRRRVEITGKIDRIDIAQGQDGNYLRIIDYKSSAKNIDLNEVYAGLQIQLITYLDAVCKVEDLMPAGILYFGLLEQMIKADKKMTDEEIEDKIKANFKMKGLILADINVVKLHDKTLSTGASKLVPAYIDKSGNLGKKTNGITKEQFTDLQNYIYKTIKEISNEILSGRIDLKPYYKNKETACKYCTYKGICNFNPTTRNNEYNYIDNKTREEVLEEIKNNQ